VQELLSKMRGDDVALVLFFTLSFLAGMIVWLSLQWRLHRRTELEAALKQDMLNRGMSAEDIERVLRASATPRSEDQAGTRQPQTVGELVADVVRHSRNWGEAR
jgi:hypothetical protein